MWLNIIDVPWCGTGKCAMSKIRKKVTFSSGEGTQPGMRATVHPLQLVKNAIVFKLFLIGKAVSPVYGNISLSFVKEHE